MLFTVTLTGRLFAWLGRLKMPCNFILRFRMVDCGGGGLIPVGVGLGPGVSDGPGVGLGPGGSDGPGGVIDTD